MDLCAICVRADQASQGERRAHQDSGLAIPWDTAYPLPGVALPRSVPGIIYGLRYHARVPSELIEWHGHNDFYAAVTQFCHSLALRSRCRQLLSSGELENVPGNCPLEAMVMDYAQLRGTLDGMDTTVITEIADYYRDRAGEYIAPRTPFVGEYFNVDPGRCSRGWSDER